MLHARARFFQQPAFLLAVLALVLAGCASTKPPQPLTPAETSAAEAEAQLRTETRRWSGTPHEWGGESRRGVDCSGLVQTFYADLFGLALPRTTRRQVETGRSVRRGELQAGDLVFFRPSRKTRHVGIYLSDGEFAHASSSAGVTTSRLGEAYWDDRYWTARRLLTFAAMPDSVPAPPPPPRPTPTPATRTGW